MRQFSKKNSEKGQILLIVVLAAVISLTVGLSVASRVVTNTKVSTDESDSQKALSAAQAGIEKKLKTQATGSETINFSNNKSSVTTISNFLTGPQLLINGGTEIDRDDGADIWLSTYPGYSAPLWTGGLKIYWTDNNADCTKNAAIEIVIITGSIGSPVVSRYALDTCVSRRTSNSFDAPTGPIDPKTISDTNFNHSETIAITNGLIARVIPLYANTSIAVEGYAGASNTLKSLPTQGFIIEATGVAGNATRKVRVFQGFPKLPTEYFPYSFFLP